MASQRSFKGHIPVLDGLRGLAILLVLVAHFNGEEVLLNYFPSLGPVLNKLVLVGLKGVDLFFVLSGFLITRILIDSKESPKYFTNFYVRRFLRIFPLYWGALFVVFYIFPHIIAFDSAASELSSNQWWLWCYLSNFPGSGFWDSSTTFKLGHFWSLAVEEHFYLLWPAAVFLFNVKTLKNVSVLWILVSFSAAILSELYRHSVWILHWSTINHSGGLALGALCALALCEDWEFHTIVSWAKKGFIFWGVLFLLLTLVPRYIFNSTTSNLMNPITAFFFVSLLILTLDAAPTSLIARFFTSRVMIYFGKISYGLYVYHGILRPSFEEIFPRIMLINMMHSSVIGVIAYFFLTVGLTCAIASLSWYLYEKQFLKLKRYFEYENRQVSQSVAGSGVP
jgi:peptidoglycan/LPS O-acetylase OafA/YrhL